MPALFPETILVGHPVEISAGWKTIVSEFESGAEQRRQQWAFPRRSVNLDFKNTPYAEIVDLWAFYRARKGAYEAFYFYAGTRPWTGEYVGEGTGAATTFDLPSRSTDEGTLTVYVNDVETAVTFSAGTGVFGADQIIFSPAPADGAILSADFTGDLRLYCRFAQDNLTDKSIGYLIWSSQLELVEVRA